MWHGFFQLGALGIGIPAFRVAGGIVVFLFGLQMIFETEQKTGQPMVNPVTIWPFFH